VVRLLHYMIGVGAALLLLLASPAHDSGTLLTFGGDSAKAAANDKGNGKGGGNDKGNAGGKGGGKDGGGKGDGKGGGKGGGGGNGSNAGNGNGSSGGNAGGNAAGNQGGPSEPSSSASGTDTSATPPAAGAAVPSASRDAAIVKIKAYREAVLGNDLEAAAAALASMKSEITAHEIGQINEILGLNSQTTTLTTEDIVRGVREIASRRP
jgi:hypothetical protein